MRGVLLAAVFAAGVPDLTRAQTPDDSVKAGLDKAIESYTKSVKQFQTDVEAHFDRREAAARKDGTKKFLDQVKGERAAFNESGELSPTATTLFRQHTTARLVLEKSYAAAVKEYTRVKKDDDATLAELHLLALKQFSGKLPATVAEFEARMDEEAKTLLKYTGKWADVTPRGHTFVFKLDGTLDEYQPSGKLNTSGPWEVGRDGKVTVKLKNGFTLAGQHPAADKMLVNVIETRTGNVIITLTLKRDAGKKP